MNIYFWELSTLGKSYHLSEKSEMALKRINKVRVISSGCRALQVV